MPPPPPQLTDDPALDRRDADLLGRWRATRDEAALQEVIARHRPMIEAVCRRIMRSVGDPDDAVQETLIALSAEAADIRERPGAWLRRVATNRALMQVRQHQRRRQQAQVEAAAAPGDEPDTESEALLRACLAELAEEDRDLLVRLFWLGETQAAIARGEGIPRVYVHRRQQRALDRLRHAFARRGVRVAAPALALLLAGGDRALAAGAAAVARPASFVLPAIGAALVLGMLGAWLALRRPTQRELSAGAASASDPGAVTVAASSSASSAPATAAAPSPAAAAGEPHLEASAGFEPAIPDGLVARLIASFDPAAIKVGIVDEAAGLGTGDDAATARGHTLMYHDLEPTYEVAAASPWTEVVRLADGRRGLALQPPRHSPLYLRSSGPLAMSGEGTTLVVVTTQDGREGGPPLATCANFLIDGDDVLFESDTPHIAADGLDLGRRRTWQRLVRTPQLENAVERFVANFPMPVVLIGFDHRGHSPAERAAILRRCPGRQGEVISLPQ